MTIFFFFTLQILFIFTGLNQDTLAIHSTKSHPNPTPSVQVIKLFQLKEHLYTFELPPKRDPPPIELIFTAQVAHIVHMSSTKFHPNPTPPTEVIKRFQLKEHLYTFELPPKPNPPPIEFIFTGQHRGASAMFPTKSYPNPSPFVRVTSDFQLKERKSTFEIPADSKSIYIPLSCRQNAIPLRLSSYSQG